MKYRNIVCALLAVCSIVALAGCASKTVSKAVPGPTTTVTVPGPTVSVPGPTKTITAPAPKPKTVTVTPPAPQAAASVSDGTYLVPSEVKPGLYKTDGVGNPDMGGCYWERDKDLSGGIDSIADNDNITGPTTIQISSSDAAIKFDGGCTWNKVG